MNIFSILHVLSVFNFISKLFSSSCHRLVYEMCRLYLYRGGDISRNEFVYIRLYVENLKRTRHRKALAGGVTAFRCLSNRERNWPFGNSIVYFPEL